MRFSRALASLALVSSTAVLAAPEPMPAPAPNPQVPDIGATLGALGNLLQGQTLDNIVSLVDNGAALLTPTFVNQTQTLISIISGVSFHVLFFT